MGRLFLAVATAGLVASLVVSNASSTSVARKTVTFHLVEKQVGFNYIDNPPHQGFRQPPLIGDEFAFTSELMTKSGPEPAISRQPA